MKIAKYTGKHHLSDYFRKTLDLRYAEAAIQRCYLKKVVLFLSGFPFKNIDESWDCRGKGRTFF